MFTIAAIHKELLVFELSWNCTIFCLSRTPLLAHLELCGTTHGVPHMLHLTFLLASHLGGGTKIPWKTHRWRLSSFTKPSWWFQPLWRIFVKLDHFPNFRGENKKCLKPPPRNSYKKVSLRKLTFVITHWFARKKYGETFVNCPILNQVVT